MEKYRRNQNAILVLLSFYSWRLLRTVFNTQSVWRCLNVYFYALFIFFFQCVFNDFLCTWAEGSSALLWSCVVPLSVRPSSLTFHIFDFSSETTEQNSTKRNRKQDLNVLYHVCVFQADWKNKMATLASDWLRHFQPLLLNRLTEFNETWQEARSQRPLPSLCFLGRSEKQDGHPGLWLAVTFSTSPLKPGNGIQRNLTGCKISTSYTKFVFFGPIRKTRWPPYHLIGWDIFNFSFETVERNSKKLDSKQDRNVFYQVCVFRAWSEKQDGCPGLRLAETFSTSPLKLLNGIQRNLTESKIWMSSTKHVFFGSISIRKWPPWSFFQKGDTLYSGARYEAL